MDLNALVRLQKAFDMTEEPVFIIIKRILDSPPTRRPRQGLPLFLDKCEPMTDFVENFSGRTTAKNNPGLGFRRPRCIPPSPVSLVFSCETLSRNPLKREYLLFHMVAIT